MSNLQAMALVAALLHLPLSLTVWSMLARRWPAVSLRLWVAGSLALGAGAMLFAAEGVLPGGATHELANLLLSLSPALRIAALRVDLGRAPRGGVLAAFCLLDFATYLASTHALPEAQAVLLGYASMALWNLVLAWHAAAAGRVLRSRSGWVLAWVEAFFAATMLLRLGLMAGGWTAAHGIDNSWDFGLMVLGGLTAALYGNLGYLGLALDRISADGQAAHDRQLAEAVRREQAESHAAALDQLLQQREQLLQTLAQHIRQPLHNASGALQAATQALDAAAPGPDGAAPGLAGTAAAQRIAQAALPLQRVQGLLGAMHTVLDNTLAEAMLLARQAELLRVDTDLDFLVQLALGDLPATQRSQVQVQWPASFRSAELEPGLVRLALRNLLLHALARSAPAAPVRLLVAEQADPPTLLLQVVDDGLAPGAVGPAAGAGRPRLPGQSGRPDGPGSPGQLALPALDIVHRVMAAHGGTLLLVPSAPRGLTATLAFPQPA